MFNIFKKKNKTPPQAELICISETEYKELLRSDAVLRLLNQYLEPAQNGYIYQIKAWELETLVETVMENFEELWSECAQQCTSFVTAKGTVKLANSAVQEIQDKEHC